MPTNKSRRNKRGVRKILIYIVIIELLMDTKITVLKCVGTFKHCFSPQFI